MKGCCWVVVRHWYCLMDKAELILWPLFAMNGALLVKFLFIHLCMLLNFCYFISPVNTLMRFNFVFSYQYGLRPIQHAAYSGTRKGVEILFEVTSRIPAIHDWSIDGIISHVKSQPKLEVLSRTLLAYQNIFTYVV
jgi:hypothetical protein